MDTALYKNLPLPFALYTIVIIDQFFMRNIVKIYTFPVVLGGTTKWLSTVDIVLVLCFDSCNNRVHQAKFQFS